MPTPLAKDGSVDIARTKTLVDYLIDGGIDGLFPLGTSGEFALFSHEDRGRFIDAVVDQVNGRIPVFAGVTDPSSDNIVKLAARAKDAGADGVTATSPFYYATTTDGLYEHFRWLAERIELPLMLYNIPEWTHLFVPPEIVRKLAEEKLIVGMKYTQDNLFNLLEFIIETGDKMAVFNGSDQLTFTNLDFGGKGAIIGSANVVPKIAASIFDEFKAGNIKAAKEAQLKLMPVLGALGIGKYPAGLKAAMRLIGEPVGPSKEPITDLSPEELEQVKFYLRKAGLKLKGGK
jgi:4-hydroxy-tetrahydrodipicolinate synthase